MSLYFSSFSTLRAISNSIETLASKSRKRSCKFRIKLSKKKLQRGRPARANISTSPNSRTQTLKSVYKPHATLNRMDKLANREHAIQDQLRKLVKQQVQDRLQA